MGVHSGRFAVVDSQSTVENWSINIQSTPQPYIASNTRGGTGRIMGVQDWNGNFQQKGGVPTKMPGDSLSFKGYTAPETDVVDTDGPVYEGDAIVDQVQLTWNWETGEPIMTVINFSGDGEVEETTDTLQDTTDPNVPGPRGLRITLGPDESGSDSDDLCTSQAQLIITAANQPYVNACTDNWTRRKPGPIDWTGTLTLHNDSGLDLPFEIGDDVELWWYVTETTYWITKWAHVVSFTGITADRAGPIIGMTVNLGMNGFNPDVGQIRLPGAGSDWWPF